MRLLNSEVEKSHECIIEVSLFYFFLYEKLRSICKFLMFHGHPHLLRIEITIFALFSCLHLASSTNEETSFMAFM